MRKKHTIWITMFIGLCMFFLVFTNTTTKTYADDASDVSFWKTTTNFANVLERGISKKGSNNDNTMAWTNLSDIRTFYNAGSFYMVIMTLKLTLVSLGI